MEKTSMTSRERVLAAMKGKPVDRVPVMYWLNAHMGCRLMAEYRPARGLAPNLIGRMLWRRFVRRGGLDAGEWTRALPNIFQGYANGHYLAELGSDIVLASIGSAKRAGRILGMVYKEDGHLRLRDPLGCVRGVGGIYLDVIRPPVHCVRDLRDFRLPDLSDTTDIRELRRAHPDLSILAEISGVQQVFSDVLWDMTQYMLALYDYPAEIEAFQRRLADWAIDQARSAMAAGADVVFIGDDYGYTGRPRISMEMWTEFTRPGLKRVIDAIHEMGGLAMLHSCGYQVPFLEHYVELGLDALQSFQPMAGNDFGEAYKRYGDRMTFVTGIDTQRGEFMSPEELREDILRNFRIGKTGGRHIMGMTHMMQYTMPWENVQMIFQAVREIREGMHG
jgi:uroporphyrinogen-III decarboxylase